MVQSCERDFKDLFPLSTLQDLHRRYAIWSTQKLRFLYPDVTAVLYETDGRFIVHVSGSKELQFTELQRFFDYEVRPAASPVHLSQTAPPGGTPVQEVANYGTELWLNGVPLPHPLFNKVLGVAVVNVPDGSLDYAREEDAWVFRSLKELLPTERATVEEAAAKLGAIGPIRFLTVRPASPAPNVVAQNPQAVESLDLVTAREFRRLANPLEQLVERDEDEWRKFLDNRAKQKLVADPPLNNREFACLYDVADRSDIRLSELLTLYDRIDLLPDREDSRSVEASSFRSVRRTGNPCSSHLIAPVLHVSLTDKLHLGLRGSADFGGAARQRRHCVAPL